MFQEGIEVVLLGSTIPASPGMFTVEGLKAQEGHAIRCGVSNDTCRAHQADDQEDRCLDTAKRKRVEKIRWAKLYGKVFMDCGEREGGGRTGRRGVGSAWKVIMER